MPNKVREMKELDISPRYKKILTELLDTIKQDVPEIHFISVVNAGGHLIASTQPELGETDIVLGAMTSAIINIVAQASIKLDKGEPTNIIVECPNGLIVLKRVNEDVLLAAVTKDGARSDALLSALSKTQSEFAQFSEIF